jgi:hypothetical protein
MDRLSQLNEQIRLERMYGGITYGFSELADSAKSRAVFDYRFSGCANGRDTMQALQSVRFLRDGRRAFPLYRW